MIPGTLGGVGREDAVNCEEQRLVEHRWNEVRKVRTAKVEAWVGVALDEPDTETGVDHEIETVHLEAIRNAAGVQLRGSGPDGVRHEPSNLGHDPLPNRHTVSGMVLVQVSLPLLQGHLVRRLKLPVILAMLLYRVVVEVRHPVEAFCCVLDTCCAQVRVPIAEDAPSSSRWLLRHQTISTYVELPLVDEERPLDVLLDDPDFLLRINAAGYLLRVVVDPNSTSSVAPLTRLHQPHPLTSLVAERVERLPPKGELRVRCAPAHHEGQRDRAVWVPAAPEVESRH
mmetsp:Transcript_54026/g.150237  ORF Transcript_54026/g.150237 Transcript_54026/m.150237 type:complete len:284 (+) Transcript_54026:522-1373(+)